MFIPCPDCDKGTIDAMCSHCRGSGEGRADGSVCRFCKGSGSVPAECERCQGTGELDTDVEWERLELEMTQALVALKRLQRMLQKEGGDSHGVSSV